MIVLLIFAVTLLAAVLISERAERSVLSTAVLFLVVGAVTGPGALGWTQVRSTDPALALIAELALVSILFADGMIVRVRDLTEAWHLPGRALMFGLPLTLLGIAMVGRWVVGMPWAESFLVAAVLSPTDPVFASAIIGRKEIPKRLRRLLNLESGINDGIALPIVVAMLAVVGEQKFHAGEVLTEVALGVVIGVVVPMAAVFLGRLSLFGAHASYKPLYAFAIGLITLATAKVLHGNIMLAAFSAGVTVANVAPEVRDSFHAFGELVSELMKLAALLMFGALISPRLLASIPVSGYLFAILALVLVRPVALAISLVGSSLNWRERVTAGWFGPKGFASVVFGILILQDARADTNTITWSDASRMFSLIALCITASIVAHSSTDLLMAGWLERHSEPGNDPKSPQAPGL